MRASIPRLFHYTIPQASTSAVPVTFPASEVSQGRGRRIGAVAIKRGMTALWDSVGTRVPCTVLQMEDVQVVSHRTKGYTAVEVGCSDQTDRRTNSALLGHFRKAGIKPKMKTLEFMVDPQRMAAVGSVIKPAHFVPGQYLDVQAKSVGKGFAGVMKRHGFAGLRASHGVSISHRSHGSTGQHQDPGRVFPGKKMAGRMGNKLRTTQNLLLLRIDNKENLLYIKGCIPGPDGSFVRVQDSVKKALAKNEFGVETLPTCGTVKLLDQLGLADTEAQLRVMTKAGLTAQ